MPESPSASASRLLSLDAVRGFAILGIFMVHAPTMGMKSADFEAPYRAETIDGLSYAAWFFMVAFFEFKFWALFALLFGVGIALQSDNADRKEKPFLGFFLRRLALLALLGVLHGLLLFPYEVLFVYAVAGMVLLPFRRLKPLVLLILGIVLLVDVTIWSAALEGMAGGEGEPKRIEDVAALSFGEIFDVLVEGDAEAMATLESEERRLRDLALTFRIRAASFLMWLLVCLVLLGWRALAMFFLGAALLRYGFFSSEGAGLRRRLRNVGFLVGLPLEIGYALSYRSDLAWLKVLLAGVHFTSSALLALAYAAVLVDLCRLERWQPVFRRLAAVGRTALSNYVLQSLVMNALFGWWLLDLRLSFPVALGVAVLTFVFQIGVSSWWLRGHTMGPLEWIWRRGSYGRSFPLRRRSAP